MIHALCYITFIFWGALFQYVQLYHYKSSLFIMYLWHLFTSYNSQCCLWYRHMAERKTHIRIQENFQFSDRNVSDFSVISSFETICYSSLSGLLVLSSLLLFLLHHFLILVLHITILLFFFKLRKREMSSNCNDCTSFASEKKQV